MRLRSKLLLALLPALPIGLALAQEPPDDTTAPAASPLAPAAAALRIGDPEEAAKILKAMDQSKLTPAERSRWRRFATLTAVRVGDKAWRDSLVKHPEFVPSSPDLMLITASRLLQDGKDDECRAMLAQVKNPEGLSEVPKRRYLTLQARLAQFAGDDKAERNYIARLVDTAGRWEKPECQACHANPRRFGEETTTLDVSRWWIGKRFSVLVRPDAPRVLTDAEKRLASDPTDGAARLRKAYALRSLGKKTEAEETLRALPWAEFPDREKRPPLRFTQFP